MRARRVDANHSQIVSTFRRCGFSVLDLSRVGCGCPDICLAKHGKTMLVEIKDGSKPPSARQLTPDEFRFHASWGGKVIIINSVDEALLLVQRW